MKKKNPKAMPPRALCHYAGLTAREEGRPWDAVYYGARVYHYERLWHKQHLNSSLKMAEQLRGIVSEAEYKDEVAFQREEYARYSGETGLRVFIGSDLDAMALPATKEKALIRAIVEWSDASGDPEALQEIVSQYRTDQESKEVLP